MQSWYLLYCKRGQLQRAQEHLERQAVNCLAPMITLEKIVRGKRTAVSEPLFPNYLFVEFDPEVIHTTTINATRGVSHFVRFGASLAIVPSAGFISYRYINRKTLSIRQPLIREIR
ncbi:transcriptional activator RfaH [Shigella sonnei]|nr:transcriptional activator RfaH [Shigella sonnei]